MIEYPQEYTEYLKLASLNGWDYMGFNDYVKIVPKATFTPRGLGDTIAKLTTKVGITPCGGCKKRQELFNEKVPYGKSM